MVGDKKDVLVSKDAFKEYIKENPYEDFRNTHDESRSYFMPLVDGDEIEFEISFGEIVGLKHSVFTKKIPKEVMSMALEAAYTEELKTKKAEDIEYNELKEQVYKDLLYGRHYSENNTSMIIDFEHNLFFIEEKANAGKIVEMFYRLFKLQLQPLAQCMPEERPGFLNWLYVEGAKIGFEKAELMNIKNELLKRKDTEEEVKEIDEKISTPNSFDLSGQVSFDTEKMGVSVTGDVKNFREALNNVLSGAQVRSLSIAHITKARSIYYHVDQGEGEFASVGSTYIEKIKHKDLVDGFITSDQIVESRWNLFYETTKHFEALIDIYRKSR